MSIQGASTLLSSIGKGSRATYALARPVAEKFLSEVLAGLAPSLGPLRGKHTRIGIFAIKAAERTILEQRFHPGYHRKETTGGFYFRPFLFRVVLSLCALCRFYSGYAFSFTFM